MMRGDYRHSVMLRKCMRMRIERYRWELLRKALPSLRSFHSRDWRRRIRNIVLQPPIDASLLWVYLYSRRRAGRRYGRR
ncbi:MAG: hypothetical protein HZRFUVUK_000302 [Candidatus Fervidibacterota bacterium]